MSSSSPALLGAMDVPAAAAGPWIVLGAVLGALLLVAAGALGLRLRSPSPPRAVAPPPAGEPRDDLADFLAHPPGTRGVPDDDGADWVPLAAAPAVRTAEPARHPTGPGPAGALAAFAVGALLLVGLGAAVAAAQRSTEPDVPATSASNPGSSRTGAAPSAGPAEGVVARLAFDGVVLEEHAVGITAAYPELELTVDDEGAEVARLRLPAVNCLAVVAPPEPEDPGCRAARTEYAELTAPALSVERDGDRLRLSGRFATSWRSPGVPAEPTGRSYDVSVSATAAGEPDAGWRPAEGELRWGDQRSGTREDGVPSVLRAEG